MDSVTCDSICREYSFHRTTNTPCTRVHCNTNRDTKIISVHNVRHLYYMYVHVYMYIAHVLYVHGHVQRYKHYSRRTMYMYIHVHVHIHECRIYEPVIDLCIYMYSLDIALCCTLTSCHIYMYTKLAFFPVKHCARCVVTSGKRPSSRGSLSSSRPFIEEMVSRSTLRHSRE